MILPAEWRSLNNFSSQPIGTGPYSVTRNNSNQLKIRAFDDYFGYRALIDEVNVWVLPDLNEELSAGLTLEGPTAGEKAFESRLEEGCYYLLFDGRSHRGAGTMRSPSAVKSLPDWRPSPSATIAITLSIVFWRGS